MVRASQKTTIPKFLQFFQHNKDSGRMSSYRVKEFLAVICILVGMWVMAIGVVEFSREGYKIRMVFA